MNMINEHVAEIDMKHVCVSLCVCARVCVCVCLWIVLPVPSNATVILQ